MDNETLLLGELKGKIDQIDKRTERMEARLDKFILKTATLAGMISALIAVIGKLW